MGLRLLADLLLLLGGLALAWPAWSASRYLRDLERIEARAKKQRTETRKPPRRKESVSGSDVVLGVVDALRRRPPRWNRFDHLALGLGMALLLLGFLLGVIDTLRGD